MRERFRFVPPFADKLKTGLTADRERKHGSPPIRSWCGRWGCRRRIHLSQARHRPGRARAQDGHHLAERHCPGLQSGAERVAQSITALSGGRLQVKVFAAGQLVGAFEVIRCRLVRARRYVPRLGNYLGRSLRRVLLLLQRPIRLYRRNEINAWVYYGGGQALWDELSAGFGLKPFLCGNTGPQMGGWFTKELTSVKSYKGLRYRMPGIGGEVLRRLGAVVVNLPGGEIIPSLQSGAIDASEFAGPWVDMALGLHKAAKYYYYPGFHEPGAALSLVVNKKLWDGFGSAERSIIETAAAAENAIHTAEFTANNAVALQQLATDPAIQIRKLDDSILQALGKLIGRSSGRNRPQGRPDASSLRELHKVPNGGRAMGRHFRTRLSQCARAAVPVRGMMAARASACVGGKAATMSLVSRPSARPIARKCGNGRHCDSAWQADCCWLSSGSAASRWSVRASRSSPSAISATSSTASRRGGSPQHWPCRKYRDKPSGLLRPRRPCLLRRRRPITPRVPGKSPPRCRSLPRCWKASSIAAPTTWRLARCDRPSAACGSISNRSTSWSPIAWS